MANIRSPGGCEKLYDKFTRKKQCLNFEKKPSKEGLQRTLTTFDLTLLGVGSTIGIGMYVLSGVIAKTDAGPAVVISFFIAACASILSGLCYAEFTCRVPSAGSAYAYSYAVIGELVAFIVGWNLLIEYAIGVASVGRAITVVVDTIIGRKMIPAFKKCCPMNVPFLSTYFDFFALLAVEVVAVILSFGVKDSAILNNLFTLINIAVIIFVIFAGFTLSTPHNWNLSREQILADNPNIDPQSIGNGGFAPFGWQGIMKGAASGIYAFVGFDCIAACSEEAKDPKKSIPRAILISLLLVFLAYSSTSLVVTMMVPYYLQDSESPLASAFEKVGFTPGLWIVTVGALCGHSSSLISSIYPMPRVIYSMASDGVIFRFLSKVSPRFHTPMVATLISGTIGGIIAGLFDLEALVDMMSIGTLTAYTIVAICVLRLRYRKRKMKDDEDSIAGQDVMKFSERLGQVFNLKRLLLPTKRSSQYADCALGLYIFATVSFCSTAIYGSDEILNLNAYVLVLFTFLALLLIFLLVSLSFQPNDDIVLDFKVPFVPWIPGLSVLVNIFLMMKLSWATWVRFGVWMLIGFSIYFICLCKGTTDKSYAEYLKEKKIEEDSSSTETSSLNDSSLDEDEKDDEISTEKSLEKDLEKSGDGEVNKL